MNHDLCVPCGNGVLNVRVGAIILKDGRLLMAGNEGADYLYSVGGRIKLGETAEEAVIREVLEETGVRAEVDRLGFVHENFFLGDSPAKLGRLIHEISFYFYMRMPDGFEPLSASFTEDGRAEFLRWVDPADNVKLFPAFFRTELLSPSDTVRHIVTDER